MSEKKEKRKPMTSEEREASLKKIGIVAEPPPEKKKRKQNGNGGGGLGPIPVGITSIPSPLFSDDSIALMFADLHEKDARYVARWSKWFFWDKVHWKEDPVLKGRNTSRQVCREVALGLNSHKEQKKVASSATISAVEKLAMSDPRISVQVNAWDRTLQLINNLTKPEMMKNEQ